MTLQLLIRSHFPFYRGISRIPLLLRRCELLVGRIEMHHGAVNEADPRLS